MNDQEEHLQKQMFSPENVEDLKEEQLEAVAGGAGCCGFLGKIGNLFRRNRTPEVNPAAGLQAAGPFNPASGDTTRVTTPAQSSTPSTSNSSLSSHRSRRSQSPPSP